MSKTTKTAAIREAQSAVGRPAGSGSSWRFYGPYYVSNPSGPSTEIRASSYSAIVGKRAKYVASVALALLGVAQKFDSISLVDYIEHMQGPMSAAQYVAEAMKMRPEDFNSPTDDDSCIDTL